MLVVIQAPHPLTPRRLQPKHPLRLPHRVQIRSKHPRHDRDLVPLGEDPKAEEDDEEEEEGELVACAVVEALGGAEGLEELSGELGGEGGCG